MLRPTVVGALAIRNDVAPEVWVLDDGGRDWVRRDVRRARRALPLAGRPRAATPRPATSTTPSITSTRSSSSPSTPTTCRARSWSSGCSATWPTRGSRSSRRPQAFYNRGFGHPRAEDDPLRNEQSIFFDVICRGKDRHGAAFWCGCPSVLRREAARSRSAASPPTTVVEDAHTSLRLNAARLARRLPRRGHGARPGARGDRRLRGPARPLGPRVAADAAARPAAVQARPHLAPAPRVHRELPALPGGPPAPDRAAGAADRAGDRRRPDRDASPLLYLAIFVPQLRADPDSPRRR